VACSLNPDGSRLYSLKKTTATGGLTKSAHPGKLKQHTFSLGEHSVGRLLTCTLPAMRPTYQSTLPLRHNHPPSTISARFSPDDKFSRHRVTIKKRFGILLTQLPAKPM
jgi:H/ACA ribonucleoprotein complex subunit 3